MEDLVLSLLSKYVPALVYKTWLVEAVTAAT